MLSQSDVYRLRQIAEKDQNDARLEHICASLRRMRIGWYKKRLKTEYSEALNTEILQLSEMTARFDLRESQFRSLLP